MELLLRYFLDNFMCKSILLYVSVSHSKSIIITWNENISERGINTIIHHDYGIIIFSMQAYTGNMKESNLYDNYIIIGASLSEPHMNGTAMREFYIILYIIIIMVRPSREIIFPAWLYGHKREVFYCAFSCNGHRPYVRRSNLANCKFTLVYRQNMSG